VANGPAGTSSIEAPSPSSTSSSSGEAASGEATSSGARSEAEPAKRGKQRTSGEGKPDKAPVQPNNVRKLRQAAMMSKAELARRAGVSPLTIDRVEAGCPCRMDTKRKILEALGLSPSAREQVFGPDIDQG
jgi:DNA-binding XRE family transcriptional regulator